MRFSGFHHASRVSIAVLQEADLQLSGRMMPEVKSNSAARIDFWDAFRMSQKSRTA
jgi:hypothetical protein